MGDYANDSLDMALEDFTRESDYLYRDPDEEVLDFLNSESRKTPARKNKKSPNGSRKNDR